MPTVYLGGTQRKISPATAIGKGGEADVFRFDNQTALKLFKPPSHPDYAGQPTAQQGALERLNVHQTKLPAFPGGLPARVIAPQQLVTDKSGGIIGYTMPLLSGTEPLKRYGERSFRDGNISEAEVLELFQDLYATVEGLHAKQVVIGDFNDLNVLVHGKEGYFIDADSMQFGPYLCKMFSVRFADPLLCGDNGQGMEMLQPHNSLSDWYAFAVLLMQSLLYVDPYGGVYRPADPSRRMPHPQRPLHRITVFHPEVQYPKPAIPYQQLPVVLQDYFRAVFEQDLREAFPQNLLDYAVWSTSYAAPPPAPLAISNAVTATLVFETSGRLLDVAFYGSRLRWLYHENGAIKRESGLTIGKIPYDRLLRCRLQGNQTVLAKGNQLIILGNGTTVDKQTVSQVGPLPLVAANQRHYYWMAGGQLLRDDRFGPKAIGQVLDTQTLFWVGEQFGLGLTRAGKLQYTFLFDAEYSGINDSLVFRPVNGHLIDATCCFSTELVWLLLAYQESGQEYRRVIVYNRRGELLADETYPADEAHWSFGLRGNAAAHAFLLASTDDGIVRIELQNGKLVLTRQFTETAPLTSRDTRLLVGTDGLYAIDTRRIIHLSIT